LLIWTGVDADQASAHAQVLRAQIPATAPSIDGHPLHCTASFGIAQWQGRCAEPINALLRRADAALYAAKHAGRDQVRVATP
jgi:diguanylate cyclase (GGDEF)-like protein